MILWSQRIVNKMQTTENQENFANCFEEHHLENQLIKFLQHGIKP